MSESLDHQPESQEVVDIARQVMSEYDEALRALAPDTRGDGENPENDPIWLIGTDPIEDTITDASTNLDYYLYYRLRDYDGEQ